MFDIGFSELLLVLIIGLVVLGPERLPVAVRTVSGWIRALRSLAASVQNELTQELKLQELQDSLKKVEQAGLQNVIPEFKASIEELKGAAESLKRTYHDEIDTSSTLLQKNAPNVVQNSDPEAIHDDIVVASMTQDIPETSIDETTRVISAPDDSPEPLVDEEKVQKKTENHCVSSQSHHGEP